MQAKQCIHISNIYLYIDVLYMLIHMHVLYMHTSYNDFGVHKRRQVVCSSLATGPSNAILTKLAQVFQEFQECNNELSSPHTPELSKPSDESLQLTGSNSS